MQNAPSVSYPVGRSALEASALLVLSTVGGGAIAWGWWDEQLIASALTAWSPWLLGLGAWLCWVLLAAWHWWLQPTGVLKWDAQATPDQLDSPPGGWFWFPQVDALKPLAVKPKQVFDGQGWMLLSLHGSRRAALWVWLERKGDPTRWDDLRRALTQHR